MKTLLLSILVLLTQAAVPVQEPSGPQEYLIGPQDVLLIMVHNHEELSRREGVPVEGDGTIEFPLLGRLKVAGLSTRQIGDLIKERLIKGGYYTAVSVSASVKDYRTQTVHVFGEGVRQPGSYPVKGNATLADAISAAGSFSLQAGAYVSLIKGGTADSPAAIEDAKPENRQEISRAEIERGAATRIPVSDGDTILVPRAEVYYISGNVQRPDRYVFTPGLTVLQAVTIAGGYTDRAAKNRVTIEREINGERKKFKVKESDKIQPNDMIHVPTRFW